MSGCGFRVETPYRELYKGIMYGTTSKVSKGDARS